MHYKPQPETLFAHSQDHQRSPGTSRGTASHPRSRDTYDVVFASPAGDNRYASHRLAEMCGKVGLSFFFLDRTWVKPFVEKLSDGEIGVRVLIDFATPRVKAGDDFVQLAREVKLHGGSVIDDPQRTEIVAHRGRAFEMLREGGVPVPHTMLVSRSEIDELTDAELDYKLGGPFVVRPAWEDRERPAIAATSVEDVRRAAVGAPLADAFLLQRKPVVRELGGRQARFRIFYAYGNALPCWWDEASREYRLVTPGQSARYNLGTLKKLAKRTAEITKLNKFSADVYVGEDRRLYSLGYVDPAPGLHPDSFFANGVPDQVIRRVVFLLFGEALRLAKRRRGFFDEDLAGADAGWLAQRKLQQMVA